MTIAEIREKFTDTRYNVLTKALVHNLTSDGALVYNELVQRSYNYEEKNQLAKDGYFFCTVDDLKYECSVLASKQQRIIKDLVKRGLIAVAYRGVPKRRYIKILNNEEAISEAFRDTREKPKPEPMPKEVKKKIKKPFDVGILKKQIDKVAAEQYLDNTDYPEDLYNMYVELFSRVGLPESAISNRAIAGCLNRLQKLDPEYEVVEHFNEYLDVYETLPCKRGHDLGMNNLLTEEMLDVIRTRMVCEPDTEVVFDF